MKTHSRTFTLIELLVVIAAILFPVFAQARQAAKKTADLSNLKNIGLGFMLDLEDNDGQLRFIRDVHLSSAQKIENDPKRPDGLKRIQTETLRAQPDANR
ncbi:hypothetical protein EON79_22225 [bacterium]|nr:MAG: hypothetical protein EON79_22225 [bacterium]